VDSGLTVSFGGPAFLTLIDDTQLRLPFDFRDNAQATAVQEDRVVGKR
jgi:hypothetical protein